MSSLINRDKKHVWHPFSQHATSGDPLPIVSAKGTLLYDEKGKSYIDANSSWWVNIHGHGHEIIGKAITDQFQALDHVIFANVTHPQAVRLAERITSKLPSHLTKVFFSDNGSTAAEVALKMCVQFWHNKGEEKTLVMALEGAYHGDTFGAMSVGERDLFNKPFEPLFFQAEYLPFPNPDQEDHILEIAEKRFASGNFAALIVEPLIQGASGMRMYSVGFLDRLMQIARKNKVLIIFDEVMTGFGRTGTFFALDQCNENPDLVMLSKGLTAGVLPLGLTVTSEEIFNSFLSEKTERGFLHGHSYTGNPIACAVANASLDIFEQEGTIEKIERLKEANNEALRLISREPNILNPRVCGTILAFEVNTADRVGYFSGIRDQAYQYALERGVLLRPLGNTIFINPPYCITREEYDHLITVIISFLRSIQE
ncbi:MAG: adenosylmethionine--8-amino-7-oxononanoate transaminase [Bacteroidetes bacterium]|nr:MAG: adenosylmethionine--8-amino-7-oxononanoate transaminase [Bacteroidota bacterium]